MLGCWVGVLIFLFGFVLLWYVCCDSFCLACYISFCLDSNCSGTYVLFIFFG